ncbi:hypothetical protein [Aeromicrobium sp.]|uniref:hypothetical protein n=1 Tax=Aeromicrobium sp. TaxID=1871063 RepID=UPI0030BB8338
MSMPPPDPDGAKFVATVEAILRAEELLAAFADGDVKALTRIMIDPPEVSYDGLRQVLTDAHQTIFALLLLGHAAIREFASEKDADPALMLQALRAWVLAAQVQDEVPADV